MKSGLTWNYQGHAMGDGRVSLNTKANNATKVQKKQHYWLKVDPPPPERKRSNECLSWLFQSVMSNVHQMIHPSQLLLIGRVLLLCPSPRQQAYFLVRVLSLDSLQQKLTAWLNPGLMWAGVSDHLEPRLVDDIQQVLGVHGEGVSRH